MAPKRQVSEGSLRRSGRLRRMRLSAEGPIYINLSDDEGGEAAGEDIQGIEAGPTVSSTEQRVTTPAARGVVINEPQPQSSARPSVPAGRGKQVEDPQETEHRRMQELFAAIRQRYGFSSAGTSAGPSVPPSKLPPAPSSLQPEGPPLETPPAVPANEPLAEGEEADNLLIARLDTIISLYQNHHLLTLAGRMEAERAEFMKEYRDLLAGKRRSSPPKDPDDNSRD